MAIYLIRHNQDHSYTGNRSFWYSDYFESVEKAADALRTRNDADTFIGWKEIEEQIAAVRALRTDAISIADSNVASAFDNLIDRLQEYSPSSDEAEALTMQAFNGNHNLIWTEGETSFDYGDFTESIEEVECDDPQTLMQYLREHPTQSADLDWVLENELAA